MQKILETIVTKKFDDKDIKVSFVNSILKNQLEFRKTNL